jgi:hypothetical protein
MPAQISTFRARGTGQTSVWVYLEGCAVPAEFLKNNIYTRSWVDSDSAKTDGMIVTFVVAKGTHVDTATRAIKDIVAHLESTRFAAKPAQRPTVSPVPVFRPTQPGAPTAPSLRLPAPSVLSAHTSPGLRELDPSTPTEIVERLLTYCAMNLPKHSVCITMGSIEIDVRPPKD